MKHYAYLFAIVWLYLLLTDCGKEDNLIAEYDNRTSYFLPDPGATDEESVLRRDFYEKENSFLLFTDTLRHEELAPDFNGDMKYFTEILDMTYSVGSSSISVFTYAYEYHTSFEAKRQSTSFLKSYILPHLSVQLRPFSWFIIYSITSLYNGKETSIMALSNERCIAIATGDVNQLSMDEKQTLSNQILSTVMSSMLTLKENEMESYYKISKGLYQTSFSLTEYTDEENMLELNKRGFIVPYWLIEGVWAFKGYCPTKENDLKSFIDLVFNTPESEVREMYTNYPIVLQKYDLLKSLFNDLGYID